jgi:hypothetical protein
MRHALALGFGSLVVSLAGATTPLAGQGPAAPTESESVSHGADAAIALRLSTLGVGLELGKQLLDHLSIRAGANVGSYNKEGKEQSDITYDVHLRLKAAELLADLAPGRRGNFHFTLGLLTNPVTIKANGRPTASGTFTINDHSYTSAQVGTLSADGKFPSVSPYLGLGFGTPARKGGRVKFLFDLGASIGKPRLSLSATGAQSNPTLQADLDAQRDKTQKDLDKVKVYPVLSLGLAFHF